MMAYDAGKPTVRAASLGFQRAHGIAREGAQAIQNLHELQRESGGGEGIYTI